MCTVGSRSQWNITKDFYVGLDVIYSKLNTATHQQRLAVHAVGGNVLPAGRPTGLYQTADQDAVSVTWRVHRDIVP